MKGTAPDYFDVLEATWPPAATRETDEWRFREGAGGGKRVSAASALRPEAEIAPAETRMRAEGQVPLFMIRPGEAALDARLGAAGYAVVDPSVIHACPVEALTDRPLPRITVLSIWEPLAIMREIWTDAGIGPARQAVMDRVQGPKTALLGRHRDKPAGVAFVALHAGVAMVHALEILPHQQRQGMGAWMMRGAAHWAAENGARTLSVVCTRTNAPANALYAFLGMGPVGEYHYRRKAKDTA